MPPFRPIHTSFAAAPGQAARGRAVPGRARPGVLPVPPAAPVAPAAEAQSATSWAPRNVWRSMTAGVEWTLIYVGFLAYMFAIITYRLPIAQPAMILCTIALFLQKEQIRVSRVFVLMGLFLAWCAIGYTQAAARYETNIVNRMTDLLKLWLIVLVAANAVRTRAQVRFLMIFCLACFALYPTRGAYFTFFLYHATVAGRAVWNYVYANPNDLAAQTLLWMCVCAGLLVTEKKGPVRTLSLLGVLMLTLLVFMTQSRGGILAMVPVALGALSFSKNQRLRTLVMVSAAAAVLALFAPKAVWDRLRGLQKATDTEHLDQVDSSAEQRFEIWKVAVAIIKQNPVFGVGVGAYSTAHGLMAVRGDFNMIAEGQRDTHSTYLNVTAETGYVGVVLFLTIFGATLAHAEGVRRRIRNTQPATSKQIIFLELGLVGFFAAGVFGSFAQLNLTYIYPTILWTLVEAVKREGTRPSLVRPAFRRLVPVRPGA